MDILSSLKFVQGAVAKKDFVPALTHFSIKDGLIKGYDGEMALCSPIALDLEASPNADRFVKAIKACKAETAMHLTSTSRLAIKSGGFKAYVECTNEPFPEIAPEGEPVNNPDGLLDALRELSPFVAEDASRPWAKGILIRDGKAYATNNIIIAEYDLGGAFPTPVNIPGKAIKELLRIKEQPTEVWLSPSSATFFCMDGRWLRTQLLTPEWPDVGQFFSDFVKPNKYITGLSEALETLAPFVGELGKVTMQDGYLTTGESNQDGAQVSLIDVLDGPKFSLEMLRKIASLVDGIDFSYYPEPCPFHYNKVRGFIIGMQ